MLPKLLLTATILSLIPSQLIRLNISETSAVNITDFFVTALILAVILDMKRDIQFPKYLFFSSMIFMLSALSSTVLSATFLDSKEVLKGSLFLFRIVGYLLIPAAILNIVKKKQTANYIKLLLATGLAFVLLGFVQLAIFPNLTQLEKYGWDPHINRLVSTTLDPNFTGMILIFFASLSLSLFLYTNKISQLILTAIFSIALVLTFSRSTYLSFIAVTLVIAALKSPRVILVPLIIFTTALLLVPTVKDRITGALTIDKTSVSRIESWQNASKIIADYPIFGVGFNNYRYFQSQYGFIGYDESGGHSGSGVDSSLLLTLATTGIFGTLAFTFWIANIFKVSAKNINSNYLSLAMISSLCALIVHSQFVNSIYFPQILMLFMIGVGLKYVQDF